MKVHLPQTHITKSFFERKQSPQDPIKQAPTFNDAKKIANGKGVQRLFPEELSIVGGVGLAIGLAISSSPFMGKENVAKTLGMGGIGAAFLY